MDPPVNALKFSMDLIIQILQRHNAMKQPEKWGLFDMEMYQKERCPMPVLEAVLGLMEHRKERIQASFDELCETKVYNINDFRFELSLTAIMYFKNGYDHFKFLNYCALLGGLAVRYNKAGHHEIPSGCAQLLGYFLNFWMYSMAFDPTSDYFELACVAQRVRRNLQVMESKKELRKAENEVKEVPEKSRKMKGDQVSGKHEAQKKPEKQKAESTEAVFKVLDIVREHSKNLPKKETEKLPETQQKSEAVPEKTPSGNDGMPEKTKEGNKKPRKARKGGKK